MVKPGIAAWAEEAAARTLDEAGALTEGLPVDLGRVAVHLGVEVRYDILIKDGYLRPTRSGFVAGIKASSPERRQRFTIAHELGHRVFLAQVGEDQPSLFQSRATSAEEEFCDKFAAALLMPRAALNLSADWDHFALSWLVERADQLMVSFQTLAWRAIELLPGNGGVLDFRYRGKPNAPNELEWRLNWAEFPREDTYIPRYCTLEEGSLLLRAIGERTLRPYKQYGGKYGGNFEQFFPEVKFDFGSLKARRDVLAFMPSAVEILAIALPPGKRPRRFDLGRRPLISEQSDYETN